MSRSGWWAAAAATAFRSGTTVWSSLLELPGTLNVTSALRPLAEMSDAPPLLSGERMPSAACGRLRSAATTCWVACRSSGSVA